MPCERRAAGPFSAGRRSDSRNDLEINGIRTAAIRLSQSDFEAGLYLIGEFCFRHGCVKVQSNRCAAQRT